MIKRYCKITTPPIVAAAIGSHNTWHGLIGGLPVMISSDHDHTGRRTWLNVLIKYSDNGQFVSHVLAKPSGLDAVRRLCHALSLDLQQL